jgi:hypothetical protein
LKYPVLLQQPAKTILTARREGVEANIDKLIQLRGEGGRMSETMFDTVHERLKNLMDKYPERLRQRDPQGGRFEAEACIAVHQEMALPVTVLADLDFWTYVSVVKLSDIVEWRHGEAGRRASFQNYGVGNRTENLILRLWMRAELVAEASKADRYDLARRGDIDLWRSHVLRQKYANCRNIAKALIRFQYPDENPTKARLSIEAIRSLAKRLRRLYANLLFSALNDEAAMEVVTKEALVIGSES